MTTLGSHASLFLVSLFSIQTYLRLNDRSIFQQVQVAQGIARGLSCVGLTEDTKKNVSVYEVGSPADSGDPHEFRVGPGTGSQPIAATLRK